MRTTIGVVSAVAMALPAGGSAATLAERAIQFAPVIYQDTADGFPNDWRNRRYDLLTRADFDGNLLGADNWANAADHPIPASVYVEAIETETHLFLFYGFFHPRDWDVVCAPFACHENDQENYRLTVRKDGADAGTPILLDGDAHGFRNAWAIDGTVTSGPASLKSGTPGFEGSHVRLFIEAKGHGPTMCTDDDACRAKFGSGDGVVYRVTAAGSPPETVEVDVSGPDAVDAEYGIVFGFESLWGMAEGAIETAFDGVSTVDYLGGRGFTLPHPVPVKWNSDDFGSEGDGRLIWGLDFVSGGQDRLLDFAFDPALSVREHYQVEGESDPAAWSMEYTCHPYFGIFDSCPERALPGNGDDGSDSASDSNTDTDTDSATDTDPPPSAGCSAAGATHADSASLALLALAVVLARRPRTPTGS